MTYNVLFKGNTSTFSEVSGESFEMGFLFETNDFLEIIVVNVCVNSEQSFIYLSSQFP